ncbi:hypothetical protein K458DRAFT_413093 [Lentithecium fluviatile CBS 122367]|uniref:Uncharacterized protein n=1 Tax=Lentithecium fluviatile CBS 122367 TaxID=1168545 RepID=A0A6G1JI93_9PLEO|nr:hypothetical protein K458DRAFT_413093 [Lentithecium fluviatile CBS 122367]
MGVSVEGGLNGVVMAAKCSGRLVGWFSPLAADVVFLSTAYVAVDQEAAPDDYETATVRGLEITDQDWQDGRLPRSDCYRVVQAWGCAPLRYASAGIFASLREEVAVATGNLEIAFGRIEAQGSGVVIT